MGELQGKTAVVTGASRGLGHAIAGAFAKEGADIIAISRTIPQTLIEEIHGYGRKCVAIGYDLSNCDGIEELAEKIISEHGDIDILCNNAGAQSRHPCADFPKADWDYVMNVNCNSVFFLCQQFGRHMLKRGRGKIINIASLLSFQGGLTVPAYAASKGAVIQFSKSFSNEWAQHGVNVNCIAPGYCDTDMNTALIADATRSEQILQRIPIGRWALPQDIAGAAVFLAGKNSDYVNGIVLPVDGGWLGR